MKSAKFCQSHCGTPPAPHAYGSHNNDRKKQQHGLWTWGCPAPVFQPGLINSCTDYSCTHSHPQLKTEKIDLMFSTVFWHLSLSLSVCSFHLSSLTLLCFLCVFALLSHIFIKSLHWPFCPLWFNAHHTSRNCHLLSLIPPSSPFWCPSLHWWSFNLLNSQILRIFFVGCWCKAQCPAARINNPCFYWVRIKGVSTM